MRKSRWCMNQGSNYRDSNASPETCWRAPWCRWSLLSQRQLQDPQDNESSQPARSVEVQKVNHSHLTAACWGTMEEGSGEAHEPFFFQRSPSLYRLPQTSLLNVFNIRTQVTNTWLIQNHTAVLQQRAKWFSLPDISAKNNYLQNTAL